MTGFTESEVEPAALAWLGSVGWSVKNGAEIAPGELAAERSDYTQVMLAQRVRDAIARLNPALPGDALEDAFRKLTRLEGADPMTRNRALHRLLVDGAPVEYRGPDGEIHGAQASVVDFDDASGNDWLAVNQFTVTENNHTRRPEIVLFLNGLALAVLELKNAADENATIWSAFQRFQTYKSEVPSLFDPNALLVVSDGVEARVGIEDPAVIVPQRVLAPTEARRRWAELLRLIFEVDPVACPQCGGAMRIVAVITTRAMIVEILAHVRARATAPVRTPRPRSPPAVRAGGRATATPIRARPSPIASPIAANSP